MRQILIKKGQAIVENVPAPTCVSGSVLVQVQRSCVSIGTELSGLSSSGRPLWRRALEQPQRMRQVAQRALSDGIGATWRAVDQRLQLALPTGYSAAGIVLEIGEGVTDIVPGDRVACAGAQFAFHADIIRVPRNLVVRIPDEVDWDSAATVTLGAIALQGVRRAEPTLGESFAVIGLGVLGQLTVQMLRANGCRTLGIDPDPGRRATAVGLGMDASLNDPERSVEDAARLTDGMGVDGVIITAATASDAVVSLAFRLCRKKGRVVLVGDVGLNLKRSEIYEKELDFRVSTSYGPGRYDRRYEEDGLEYPIGYVRWTENRNMAEYLRMLGDGRVRVAPLVSAIHPVDRAQEVYAELARREEERALLVLFDFPPTDSTRARQRVVELRASPSGKDRVRLAVVGAGEFARATHLPNIAAMADCVELRSVVSRSGANAVAIAREYNAVRAGTALSDVLGDGDVDAVLIATRHNLHAEMTRDALRAGKHVLVEKPLAITELELTMLDRAVAEYSPAGERVVLTGFNRRFSPHITRLKELVAGRTSPLMLTYRMNAGYLAPDHWTHGREGGGRNIGEACHVYDLFAAIVGSPVCSVHVACTRPSTAYYRRDDNFIVTLEFTDGSVATLVYTALGSRDLPKERLEAFADGVAYVLDDYRSLSVHGRRAAGLTTRLAEKGHREELAAFVSAVRSGAPWPISWAEQRQASWIAIEVQRQLGPAPVANASLNAPER